MSQSQLQREVSGSDSPASPSRFPLPIGHSLAEKLGERAVTVTIAFVLLNPLEPYVLITVLITRLGHLSGLLSGLCVQF